MTDFECLVWNAPVFPFIAVLYLVFETNRTATLRAFRGGCYLRCSDWLKRALLWWLAARNPLLILQCQVWWQTWTPFTHTYLTQPRTAFQGYDPVYRERSGAGVEGVPVRCGHVCGQRPAVSVSAHLSLLHHLPGDAHLRLHHLHCLQKGSFIASTLLSCRTVCSLFWRKALVPKICMLFSFVTLKSVLFWTSCLSVFVRFCVFWAAKTALWSAVEWLMAV